jgi:hypothetical protein
MTEPFAHVDLDDLHTSARIRTRATALALVREHYGPQHVTDRPPYDGAGYTRPAPEPLAALGALWALTAAARRDLAQTLSDARAEGATWDQVAAALAPRSLERVFALVAGDGGQIRWRCATCRGRVTDAGPEYGPETGEDGHTPACPRHGVDIDAAFAEAGE